jgi:hypothetical protein
LEDPDKGKDKYKREFKNSEKIMIYHSFEWTKRAYSRKMFVTKQNNRGKYA